MLHCDQRSVGGDSGALTERIGDILQRKQLIAVVLEPDMCQDPSHFLFQILTKIRQKHHLILL